MVARRSPERGGDARLARGVPWIFKDEAANVEELRALGRPALLANVESEQGVELGSAVCNLQKGGATGSVNILARMVADNINVNIDRGFFAQRVRRALQHREHLFGRGRPYYRLLNAEGDHLPGVLCDRYGDVLVVQFAAAAMELLFEKDILDALEEVLSPKAIIVRYDVHTDRQLELAPLRAPYVARGAYVGPTEFTEEDGFAYQVDLLEAAFSSGRLFADRPLRALLSSALAAGGGGPKEEPRALSLFGESLGVLAASRGCRAACAEGLGEVTSARLASLARLNSCQDRLDCLRLERPQKQLLPERLLACHDVVTLEPPALAPTYGKLEEGLQQYAAWTGLAAAALRPGGLLLVVCRSRTVTAVKLLRSVNMGLWSAGRRARLVHRSVSGPGDFPVHLALPGTSEMQALALRAF